jgi:hypothetical protein
MCGRYAVHSLAAVAQSFGHAGEQAVQAMQRSMALLQCEPHDTCSGVYSGHGNGGENGFRTTGLGIAPRAPNPGIPPNTHTAFLPGQHHPMGLLPQLGRQTDELNQCTGRDVECEAFVSGGGKVCNGGRWVVRMATRHISQATLLSSVS